MPTAFDEAGIRMLDSIREIFDILGFESDSVGFKYVQYKNSNELTTALKIGKCPVVGVLRKDIYSPVKYIDRIWSLLFESEMVSDETISALTNTSLAISQESWDDSIPSKNSS